MKTILITGANGFVSWYLIHDLLQQEHKVIATGKGPSRLLFQHPNLFYETLDFTNEAAVNAVFQKYKPDVVVHAGAISKPDECELNRDAALLTNVKGTVFLLQAAAQCKSFFLFLSTDFVFEGKRLNYRETDALHPVNYYGDTKKLAEAAVQNYAGKWSIVRPILVYGKPMSGRQNILTIVAQMLQNGAPYKVVGDQTRKPTYVEDLAVAMLTIITKEATGIFNICGSDVLTPYQMACAVAEHLGYAPDLIEQVTAATFKQPAVRPPVTGFDLSKAAAELAYTPTSFAEGLKRTFSPLSPEGGT